MTNQEKAVEYLKRLLEIQEEMNELNKQELTEEVINKKLACLSKLVMLSGEVYKLNEQKREAGERRNSDNQREGEQYDTIN